MFLVLLLGMVVGTVFVCGLYVGSAFMQEHNSLDFKPTFQILSEGRGGILRGGEKGRFGSLNPVQALENKLDSWLHRHTPEPIGHPALGGAGARKEEEEEEGKGEGLEGDRRLGGCRCMLGPELGCTGQEGGGWMLRGAAELHGVCGNGDP